MLSFYFKIIVALFTIILLILVIPNPIHNRFPQWIKNYENYTDPQSNKMSEFDQIEVMTDNPLKCYKTSDCELILCGKVPNCHSIAINKDFYSSHKDDLPFKYQCPTAEDIAATVDDCGKNAQLDAYAACQQSTCVVNHLLPTPTPSPSSIIEKAVYGK